MTKACNISKAQAERLQTATMRALSSSLIAVTTTTAVQTLVTMASLAVSVFAPLAAKDIGVAPGAIGAYASLTYVGAMLGSLIAGGYILRYGAMRFTQLVMLLCAVGLALCVGGHWAWFLISALIFGLGYGPTTPASSYILSQHTPQKSWSLLFSIKQTGVPLGGALAGLIVPWLLLYFNWREVTMFLVASIVLGVGLLQPFRQRFDGNKIPAQPLAARGIIEPLRLVMARPDLRLLVIASFCFSSTQQSFVYFLVTYLQLGIGWTTQAAGTGLSMLGFAAIFGRIGWGALADKLGRSQQLLGLLALAMAVAIISAAFFSPAWPTWAVLFVCAAFGATGASWNGIYLAEITRSVAPDQVGHATGAALFVTFAGVVITPPLVGLAVDLTAGFRLPLMLLGVLCTAIGITLLKKNYR